MGGAGNARTTTLPAADAISIGPATGTTGNLTVGSYSNDMVANQNQGGATRGYTRDPAQNRIAAIDDGTTTVNCYTDSTDAPAWTLQEPIAAPARTPANTTWIRNLHCVASDSPAGSIPPIIQVSARLLSTWVSLSPQSCCSWVAVCQAYTQEIPNLHLVIAVV